MHLEKFASNSQILLQRLDAELETQMKSTGLQIVCYKENRV